ncbi:MAG: AraC family transcriptional regulator [Eubacteriales bacterium]|nr:AraC family transcriptional regulator [Eubacteriales bacterium]
MKQQHFTFTHNSIHRNIPLKVSHMNLYHCDDMTTNFLDAHTYPKILFVYNGAGFLQINDHSLSFNKNEIVIIKQGAFSYQVTPNNGPVDFALVGFDDIDFSFSKEIEDKPFLHIHVTEELNCFFMQNIVKELQEKNDLYHQVCNYYVNLLFIQLKRESQISYQIQVKEKINSDCEFIRNYLDEHYTEDITLDTLSEISKMNKYYLVHSFTNTYGCSPINYLNEKKIDESKILLETTDYPIAKVAKMIGYSSQSYFSQSFKKHTYMTPNEYRRFMKQK